MKYIQQETSARVQIKGLGSGFIDQETGREHDEPLFIHITYVPRTIYFKSLLIVHDLLALQRRAKSRVQKFSQRISFP